MNKVFCCQYCRRYVKTQVIGLDFCFQCEEYLILSEKVARKEHTEHDKKRLKYLQNRIISDGGRIPSKLLFDRIRLTTFGVGVLGLLAHFYALF